ncbi:MAG: NucA/NucB deoxyribonuclease domain-containing protein [Granulosicoccaceae bacterium]
MSAARDAANGLDRTSSSSRSSSSRSHGSSDNDRNRQRERVTTAQQIVSQPTTAEKLASTPSIADIDFAGAADGPAQGSSSTWDSMIADQAKTRSNVFSFQSLNITPTYRPEYSPPGSVKIDPSSRTRVGPTEQEFAREVADYLAGDPGPSAEACLADCHGVARPDPDLRDATDELTAITEGLIGLSGVGGAALGIRDVAVDPSIGTLGMAVAGVVPGVRAGKAVDNITDAADAVKDAAKSSDLPTVVFTHEKTPGIAKNIEKAQANGHPDVINRLEGKLAIDNNRREALRGHNKASSGYSLDEYPFASSKQGGKGAQVAPVKVTEQHSQGGTLSSFYDKNNIKDGDAFKVEIRDK